MATMEWKQLRKGALAWALLLLLQRTNGYYLPGVQPYGFAKGQSVKLKVNKLTSSKTLLPVDYYRLPFCQPEGGPKMDNQNLGEFLAGDRIQSSPYRIWMMEDMYCEQLCITNLGRGEQKGISPNKMVRAIRKNYHTNWIVDNLPAASKVEDDTTITTRYWQGFPVGFIASDTKKAYVHNHVNIEIQYHSVETEPDKARVVRFTVEPFSIKHDFDDVADDDDDSALGYKAARITNPIESCNPQISRKEHTRYEMVYARGREHQPAAGKVLFTYDVIWTENKNLHWASRWDIYLTMDNAIPSKVHWLPTVALGILLVVGTLASVIIRVLLRNIRSYNSIAADESQERAEHMGWTAVHADVFRPPSFSPMLLSVCCGSGCQLLCTTVVSIALSAVGRLSPANRGSMITAQLLLYTLLGIVGGYVAARLYKTFKGENRWPARVVPLESLSTSRLRIATRQACPSKFSGAAAPFNAPNVNLGTIEGRSAAFRRDRLFVEEKLALGKVVLSMCRLSDQNNVYHIGVPAQDQTQDLNLARVDVNRHTASFYDLMSTQLHYNINATPAITDGGHLVHFQAPYYRVTGGRNNLQATPIDLPSAIHGADPLNSFLNWNGNLDILGLWNTPGVNTQIPPDGNVCAANPAYPHCMKNVERLGPEAVLRARMGNHRFEQHYANFARTQLHMVDGGTAYLLAQMGRNTIMPTAMQGPNSILSQGHNYNNVVQTYGQNITGNVFSQGWNTNAPNAGGAARVGTLRPVLNNALQTFQTSAVDANRFEDTMHAYGNVSWFSAWEGHVSKTDRQPMNSVNRTSNPVVPQTSEFGFGATAHVLRHRDVVRAGWTGLDSYNNADHQQIVRMRLPTDIWATYHVVNGPPAFPISQAKFIKYWDCYRPMYDPELWWFSISA